MPVIKISSKGQIVIPRTVREKLDLRQGDQLSIGVADGKIILEPLERHPLLVLQGALKEGNSLTEALLDERRRDRAKEDSRHG